LDAERVTVFVRVTVEGFATLCDFVTVTVFVVTLVTGLQTVEEDFEEERVVVGTFEVEAALEVESLGRGLLLEVVVVFFEVVARGKF